MVAKSFNRDLITTLKFCCGGILLLLLFCYVIDYGVAHSTDAQTGKINSIVEHRNDPAVVIFGSSVSEVGINPLILQNQTANSVYNYSINGTRFMQYKGLMDEFSTNSRNVKYVVMAENYFSLTASNAITSVERYLSHISNNNIYNALYKIQPELMWKCRYIPFYKYVAVSNGYYKNALLGWKNILKGTAIDSTLGFFPVDRKWEEGADETLSNMQSYKIEIDSMVISEYIRTIRILQKQGRQIIVVLCPIYEMALKKIVDINPLRLTFNQIAVTTGCRFIDISKNGLFADKSMFYNSTHLNKKGADVFSKILADSLVTIMNKKSPVLPN